MSSSIDSLEMYGRVERRVLSSSLSYSPCSAHNPRSKLAFRDPLAMVAQTEK